MGFRIRSLGLGWKGCLHGHSYIGRVAWHTLPEPCYLGFKVFPSPCEASFFLVIAAIADVLIPHYVGETINEIIRAEDLIFK